MRKFLFVLAALGIASAVVARSFVIRWKATWGVAPGEGERAFPGDDLIPDPDSSETRGIDIEAPPDKVWPWLAQMGFGRGGWYSYDAIDMGGSSSRQVLPEFQQLAVGDVLPTYPGGGFLAKVVDPGRALVLYSDATLAKAQLEEAKAKGAESGTANVRASDAVMAASQPPDFAASWAFVLEPMDGNRTRLLERVRAKFDESGAPWMRYTLPLMGFGVFVMERQHMIGVRDRAEAFARGDLQPAGLAGAAPASN